MFCEKCGHQLEDGSRFCEKCGTKAEEQGGAAAHMKPQRTAAAHNGAPAKTGNLCPKCGNNLTEVGVISENGVLYCKSCWAQLDGTQVNAVQAKGMTQGETAQSRTASRGDICSRVFVEPDEVFVASLGNSYLQSFISKSSMEQCSALLSDQRIYLRGSIINIGAKKITKTNIFQTIDLEDVTGTGFIYLQPKIWQLILGLLLAVPTLVVLFIEGGKLAVLATFPSLLSGLILIYQYIMSEKTYFFIEYAGGAIKFEASIYSMAESRDFEKQIRRAKNHLKRKR